MGSENNSKKAELLVYKREEAIIIEIGITSQNYLKIVKTEKFYKYDLLADEISLLHRCSTRIVPYVVT